jgi:Protein of unknown function (DUF3175)
MVKRSGRRKWVARVQSSSDAMDLEPGVFKKKSAKGMAKSILRSVKRSQRKKGSTLSSGISMMTYYVNRGGKKLSPQQEKRIKKAKDEYRKLVGRKI